MGEWASQLPTDCVECEMHVWSEPNLGEAIPSVATSRGIASYEVLRQYLAGFHARGHKISDVGEEVESGDGAG